MSGLKNIPGYLYGKTLLETDVADGEHRVWFVHDSLKDREALIDSFRRAFVWQTARLDGKSEVWASARLSSCPETLMLRVSCLPADALGRIHTRLEAFLVDSSECGLFETRNVRLLPELATKTCSLEVLPDGEDRGPCQCVTCEGVSFKIWGPSAWYVFEESGSAAGRRDSEEPRPASERLELETEKGAAGMSLFFRILFAGVALLAVGGWGYSMFVRQELQREQSKSREISSECRKLRKLNADLRSQNANLASMVKNGTRLRQILLNVYREVEEGVVLVGGKPVDKSASSKMKPALTNDMGTVSSPSNTVEGAGTSMRKGLFDRIIPH